LSQVGWDGTEADDRTLILGYRYAKFTNYLVRYLPLSQRNWTRNQTIFINQAGGEDHIRALMHTLQSRGLFDIADNGYAIQIEIKAMKTAIPTPKLPPLNLEEVTYEIIPPDQVADVLRQCILTQSPNAVDTETTGDNPHSDRVVLIQIAAPNLPVFLIPTDGLTTSDLQALRAYFSNSQLKLFQNGKFDVKMLKSMGINVTSPLFDTMLASRILSCGLDEKHGLGAIALKYLGVKLDKSLQQSFKPGQALTHQQCLYGAIDPLVLLYLHLILQQKLRQFTKANAIANAEFELLKLIAQMEYQGAGICWDRFHKEHVKLADQVARLENLIHQAYSKGRIVQPKLFGGSPTPIYDLSKPADVKALLNQQGITTKQGRSGVGKKSQSIDDTLLTLWDKHPLVEQILKCRHSLRLHNLYANLESARPKDSLHPTPDRVAGSYVQIDRTTGELGESRTGIEKLMCNPDTPPDWLTGSRPNQLIWLNLHQLEFRILAHVSRDERLVHLYQQHGDFYQDIVQAVIDPLVQVQQITILEDDHLPLAYAIAHAVGTCGWGEVRLQRHAYREGGVLLTKPQAKQIIQRFRSVYPGIAQYHQDIKDYTIKAHTTLWGRYRSMKKTSPYERSAYLVQGSASDLIKQCILRTHTLYPSPRMQVVLVLKHCVGIEVSPSRSDSESLESLCQEWTKLLQQSVTLVPCRVVSI
jgi:DNA polymerase I